MCSYIRERYIYMQLIKLYKEINDKLMNDNIKLSRAFNNYRKSIFGIDVICKNENIMIYKRRE